MAHEGSRNITCEMNEGEDDDLAQEDVPW